MTDSIRIFSVDVETATTANNSICQVAIAQVIGDEPTVVFQSLVKPPNNEFARELSGIHGIYPEDTQLSPTFDQVWSQIESYFDGLLVAHNATFDIIKLSGTLEYYGLSLPPINYVCTYELSGLKLPLACKAYGIEHSQHHNAASDAIASLRIYHKHVLGVKPNIDIIIEESASTNSFFSYKQVESDLLKPLSGAPDNYLNGKKLVFTGDLQSLSRNKAAKAAQKLGADVNTSISKHTHIVVLGRGAGPKKLEKITELQSQGHQIEIIKEPRFLDILSFNK
ncbi:MAG: hypothetical protein HQ470_04140 [Methylophilales bacterium]|nr:hypothetical protein [Methylophilales bacterium]